MEGVLGALASFARDSAGCSSRPFSAASSFALERAESIPVDSSLARASAGPTRSRACCSCPLAVTTRASACCSAGAAASLARSARPGPRYTHHAITRTDALVSWDQYNTARAGTMPFHRDSFGDYLDLGLQAENGRFRVYVLVFAWEEGPRRFETRYEIRTILHVAYSPRNPRIKNQA